MDINKLTIGEVKEIAKMVGCDSTMKVAESPIEIGEKLFFRTVTYHLLGEVEEIHGNWVLLKKCCWVADSGRWHTALADGELSEVEMCGDYCWVNLDTVTDIHPWNHKLPTKSK